MEKPTARETTQATRPAPYPMTVPSSMSAAWAAKGAMAVAKAARAAALESAAASARGASSWGAMARGARLWACWETGAKAVVHATRAARRTATKVFIFRYIWG